MDNGQQNEHKTSGELEQRGLEPLPPTPLSYEAQVAMEKWGLTEESMESLRQFTSLFRYDLCAQKIERLSQKGAEVYDKGGQEFINMPSFYDVDGRLVGQCGDIGRQWVIQMNELNLIDALNSERDDGSRIVTCFYAGLSKTHFCNEDSGHVWNGLALVDNKGAILDEVYVDAAFQTIMTKAESGYVQSTATLDPGSIEASEHCDIPVGRLEDDGETSWRASFPGEAVLGVSDDFQYVYTLTFVKDTATQEVKPVIGQVNREGKADRFFYGHGKLQSSVNDTDYTNEHVSEIKHLLDQAGKIEIQEKEPTINRVSWVRRDIAQAT